MAGVLEYKCPCCGGAIRFDSSIQKMKCPYCDTEFELDTLKEFEEEYIEEDQDPTWREESVRQSGEKLEDEEGKLASYICEACGGEIIAEKTMAASSCPYCGNPVIVMKQLSGALRPDVIIPFKLDKKTAEERFRAHLKGKALLPGTFKSENRIQEIKGVYVPFWLYDGDVEADISCRATRTRVWRQRDYEYIETSHYLVKRSGTLGFDKVPADGSSKMADDLMQSIEPFGYEEAVPFRNAYLAGYLADKYDLDAGQCAPAVNERMKQNTVHAFMNTMIGYDSCIPEHTSIRLKEGEITYALLPVWVLNTMYHGKLHTFAMNGQTGKFVGNLPADKGKAAAAAGAAFGLTAILVFIITLFF